MFDPFEAMFGGVQVIAVVFGLVEFLKNLLSLDGKKVTILAASVGAGIYALVQLVGIVPEPYGQILEIVMASVVFGLTASGYYKFVNARLPEREAGKLPPLVE